jgi:hypothetical protein
VTSFRTLALAYAAISSVYLWFLPDALPMLDDWVYLRLWDQARSGGVSGVLTYLARLIDNTYNSSLRINWVSYLPAFGLSFLAGSAGGAYFLLGWTAHWLSAVLLCRLIEQMFDAPEAGFLAGAVYSVLPSSNYVLFGPLSASFYFFQVLLFLWWFPGPLRLRRLPPVVCTGEQILPALVLLPLLRPQRPRWRAWLAHVAAMAALVAAYVLLVNRVPVLASFARRYDTAQPFSLRPVNFFLVGSLGFAPEFARWRPVWRPEPLLAVSLVLAAGALVFLLRTTRPGDRRLGELMLWSVAGAILTYLPIARLATFEWRYLYVPVVFLVALGAAMLGLLPRPARLGLGSLAVLYFVSYTYFEMRQCWVPQSRVALAALDAIRTHGPFRPGEVVILSGGPPHLGPAPAFVTGAIWSLRSVLPDGVIGARDLVVNEQGDLFLFHGDGYTPFHRDSLSRVRAFSLDSNSNGRFVPLSAPVPRPVSGHEIALRLRPSP